MEWVTAILAIATALVTAANVALNPAKKSQRSYKLGYAYHHVQDRAQEFINTRLNYILLDKAAQELTRIGKAKEKVDEMAVESHGVA